MCNGHTSQQELPVGLWQNCFVPSRQTVTCCYAKAKTKFNTDVKYFKHFL